MKRLLFFVLVAVFLVNAVPATAKKLPAGEARLQARLVMYDFTKKRDRLSYPKARCVRKSKRKMRCKGISTGETKRYTVRCKMVAVVVNRKVRYNYGHLWEARARLVRKRCKSTRKPWLTERAARSAAQAEADRVAGRLTTIDYLFRSDGVTWAGTASWEQPGDFGTDFCSVDLEVKLVKGRVAARTDGFTCF